MCAFGASCYYNNALQQLPMGCVNTMFRKQNGWCWLCSLVLLCVIFAACENGQSKQKGSGDMFGLLGKKYKKTETVVATEVGGVLQAHSSEPETMPPPVKPSFPQCEIAYIRGNPITGQWVPEDIQGETEIIYHIPAGTNSPPLALFATGHNRRRIQLWELSDGKQPRFLKQRPVQLDADQDSWIHYSPLTVSTLPDGKVLLAVGYHDPHSKEALYLYNPVTNHFRHLSEIEPVMTVLPFIHYEIMYAAPNVALVQYYTDSIRLAPEDYVYGYNHFLLFSSRYPEGIEILKLGIDDGNVHGWGMQDKTLWMRTHDKRKQPKNFIWSLDLTQVL